MTFSELFFGEVEMPVRVDRLQVDRAVEKVREAIALEAERQAEEERRRAAESEAGGHEEEVSDSSVRHKSFIGLDRSVLPFDPFQPAKKCPPNLKANVLSFSAQLLMFVKRKCGGRGVVAYKRAGIRRNVYSRIISDDRAGADKRTVLQFCLGLQLTRSEADALLWKAGYALSETIPEDVAFGYCIDHAIWNLEDVNEILSQCNLKPIEIIKE